MRLSEARLCANCDEVYSALGVVVNAVCPNCASAHHLNLAKILNRTNVEPTIIVPIEQICVQCDSTVV
jgi:hypothetical protein